MYKIKAVAFDLTGGALDWLNQFADEDHMDLCEIITLDDDSPIAIADLPMYDNWDVLLVFENGVRNRVELLLDKIGISKDRIIYPMDMEDINSDIASYIFNDSIRKLLKYFSYRTEGYKYGMSYAEGFTYINAITDDVIIPRMIFDRVNWAKDDMENFYKLAQKHFRFNEEQVLFCDIGANIGTTCVYFKKQIDPDVKILAFEPSEQNYRLLRVNALLNEIDENDCMFVKKGVSDKTCSASFKYNPENPGGSSVVSEEASASDTVELVSLDDFFEKSELDPQMIKYIWIDVEGFEARLLAGAHSVLRQIEVPIFMEFIPQFYSETDGEFELLMRELESQFTSFICMQEMEKGIQPISNLRKEKNNRTLEWDLFLLKS